LGSIGVGFGFKVGTGPSTGVGFCFGEPLREELAGEGVTCAFTSACSCLFLNSSAAFFSCCFCRKKAQPRPRRMTTKTAYLITKTRGRTCHTVRAFDSLSIIEQIIFLGLWTRVRVHGEKARLFAAAKDLPRKPITQSASAECGAWTSSDGLAIANVMREVIGVPLFGR
jgi:hypothetical protein